MQAGTVAKLKPPPRVFSWPVNRLLVRLVPNHIFRSVTSLALRLGRRRALDRFSNYNFVPIGHVSWIVSLVLKYPERDLAIGPVKTIWKVKIEVRGVHAETREHGIASSYNADFVLKNLHSFARSCGAIC
jgi:hypothetical protein